VPIAIDASSIFLRFILLKDLAELNNFMVVVSCVSGFGASDEIHIWKFWFMQVARKKVWEIDLIGCQNITKMALGCFSRAIMIYRYFLQPRIKAGTILCLQADCKVQNS
jgi:hypothetical protein